VRPTLAIRSLNKSYATPVLDGVDLDLLPGEVHALVGENGAGKSTLSRILAGLTHPDSGTLELDGKAYTPSNKRAAEQAGIHLVMQELNLIRTLSVAENIFLDHLPHRAGWIRYSQLHRDAAEVLARIGLPHLDPQTPVEQLGVGQQQMVEIASRLWRPCRVLILDEPTAALTDPEVASLFQQLRQLQSQGVAILYISHRLEEIRQIAHRISVLRDGHLVATRLATEFPIDDVVRLMVGRELGTANFTAGRSRGPIALAVRNLHAGDRVQNISFDAFRGEILGIAGLMGSGRTETVRAIFGADPIESGQVFLHGNTHPADIRSPRDAVRLGIALLTEDRKGQGLFLSLAVRENLTVNTLQSFAGTGGWISRLRESASVRAWLEKLQVRCESPEQGIAQLSGGNQQKVVVARWLLHDCDILLFDEPTRGVDVGARFEIYQLLADLAAQGKCIVVVSSDLTELMMISDRIAVLSNGRLAAEFTRDAWTQDKIMTAALSGYLSPTTTL
jgi:ribose transport system ATP-binding protein